MQPMMPALQTLRARTRAHSLAAVRTSYTTTAISSAKARAEAPLLLLTFEFSLSQPACACANNVDRKMLCTVSTQAPGPPLGPRRQCKLAYMGAVLDHPRCLSCFGSAYDLGPQLRRHSSSDAEVPSCARRLLPALGRAMLPCWT